MKVKKPLLARQRIRQEIEQFQTNLNVIQWRSRLASQGFAIFESLFPTHRQSLMDIVMFKLQEREQNGTLKQEHIEAVEQELLNLHKRLITLESQVGEMVFQALSEPVSPPTQSNTVRHRLLQVSGQISPILTINLDPAVVRLRGISAEAQKAVVREVSQTIKTINHILRR